jgi:hypothetical protein
MMRRPVVLVLALLAAASAAFAVDVPEIPFAPVIPEIAGQGGAMIANAHGWGSFFANPAGLSRDRGAATLFESGAWAYGRPDRLGQFALDSLGGTSDPFGLVNGEVTSGGFGVGGSIGLGYAGNGLGLGLALVTDSYFWGPTAMGASGDLTMTLAFMGGVAYPFRLGGAQVHVGALVRPMIRVHAPLTNADTLQMFSALATGGDLLGALGSASAVYGVGIGLDAGAIAELGWFSLGVAVRDIGGTAFSYSRNSLASVASAIGGQLAFPAGSVVEDRYVIPMDVGFGVAFHPDLGSAAVVVDPSLHLDVDDAVSVVQSVLAGDESYWTRISLGAEVRLLSFLSAWAGLDGGYLTFGTGLHLLFIDASLGVFTRELGQHIGDRPSSGVTLEVAIRF